MNDDDDDTDADQEVRIGRGVALIDDVAERHDALLDVDTNEHVDETDDNVDREHDRHVGAAVLTSLGRQVQRQPRHCLPVSMSHAAVLNLSYTATVSYCEWIFLLRLLLTAADHALQYLLRKPNDAIDALNDMNSQRVESIVSRRTDNVDLKAAVRGIDVNQP